MTIYVIGNSHIDIFNYNNRFTLVQGNTSTSSATAHNLNKKNSTSNSNEILFKLLNNMDRQKDSVILVYGEVDCRVHFYYQYEKNNKKYSISELIDNTINNYSEVLKQIHEMGIKFYVCSTPPPSRVSKHYMSILAYISGPDIFREFNQKLKLLCINCGYRYLDIYSKTVNKEGRVKIAYEDDGVHLTRNALDLIINEITDD